VVTNFSEGNLKGKTFCVKINGGGDIEMDLKEMGRDVRYRIYLALDWNQ
jgi:hypothetical protein